MAENVFVLMKSQFKDEAAFNELATAMGREGEVSVVLKFKTKEVEKQQQVAVERKRVSCGMEI